MRLPKPESHPALEGTPILAFRTGTNSIVLFHTQNGRWAEVPAADAIPLASRRLDTFASLIRSPDLADYRPYSMTIDVFPAAQCNMACRYCVNGGGNLDGGRAMLSEELARKTVERVFELAEAQGLRRLQINIYGGEPLLNRKASRILLSGFLERDSVPTFVNLKTNGTIVDDSIFSVFREHHERATLWMSIDGDERQHDANRIYRDERPTYARIIALHDRLRATGITPSVSAVVGYPYHFIETVQALAQVGVRRLNVKPVKRAVYGIRSARFRFQTDVFNRQYRDYNTFALTCTEPLLLDRKSRIRLFGFLFRNGLDDASFCGVGSFRLGIFADGRFYPCPSFASDKTFALGDVRGGLDWERLKAFRERLGRRSPVSRPDCTVCTARMTCAGGCFADNQEKRRDIGAIDSTRCLETRARLVWALAFWLAQEGALAKEFELPPESPRRLAKP